jgi:outer membrane protein OmpA-like peptidoglycan-associated protein
MRKLNTTIAAMLIAFVTVSLGGQARADGTAILGLLTCTKTGPGDTYVIYSRIPVACSYQGVGGSQDYTGVSGILLGLDLEIEKEAAMVYAVIGHTSVNPGGLAGTYAGVKASATLGVGPAVQAGLAGAGNGFDLVPLGLGGQMGVGVTVGVAYLQIAAAAPPAVPAPEAAASPAPAPAPAPQIFTVYFAFNKSALTPDARRIIGEAAAYAKRHGAAAIKLDGYTDLAGTAKYNLALSKRRAEVVRHMLLRQGIEASRITVKAYGKSNPAVPTPEGVREPRNRRTVIVIEP